MIAEYRVRPVSSKRLFLSVVRFKYPICSIWRLKYSILKLFAPRCARLVSKQYFLLYSLVGIWYYNTEREQLVSCRENIIDIYSSTFPYRYMFNIIQGEVYRTISIDTSFTFLCMTRKRHVYSRVTDSGKNCMFQFCHSTRNIPWKIMLSCGILFFHCCLVNNWFL